MQAEIERLATLPIVEREQQRKAVAKKFGVRASVVDTGDNGDHRQRQQRLGWQGATAVVFRAVEPWAEPVNGAGLLDDITAQIHKYVIVSRHGANAAALWIVQSEVVPEFRTRL